MQILIFFRSQRPLNQIMHLQKIKKVNIYSESTLLCTLFPFMFPTQSVTLSPVPFYISRICIYDRSPIALLIKMCQLFYHNFYINIIDLTKTSPTPPPPKPTLFLFSHLYLIMRLTLGAHTLTDKCLSNTQTYLNFFSCIYTFSFHSHLCNKSCFK